MQNIRSIPLFIGIIFALINAPAEALENREIAAGPFQGSQFRGEYFCIINPDSLSKLPAIRRGRQLLLFKEYVARLTKQLQRTHNTKAQKALRYEIRTINRESKSALNRCAGIPQATVTPAVATPTVQPTTTPKIAGPIMSVDQTLRVSEFGTLVIHPRTSDPQGLPVRVRIVRQPQFGVASVHATEIQYVHTSRNISSDSFDVVADNGFVTTPSLTLPVTIVTTPRDNPEYIKPTTASIISLPRAPHPRLKDYSGGERTLELAKSGDAYALQLVNKLRARAENAWVESSQLLKPLPVYADSSNGHWRLARDTMCELYHSSLYLDGMLTGTKIRFAKLNEDLEPILSAPNQPISQEYTPQQFRQLIAAFGKRLLQRYADPAYFPTWGGGIDSALASGYVLRTASQLYDCLYHELTSSERLAVRNAMKRNVLDQYRNGYITGTGLWWLSGPTNWTSDVNGAVLWAALAIIDEEPEYAAPFIAGAIKSVHTVLKAIGPDGAWHEGMGGYTTMTGTGLMAMSMALEKTYGIDFGISEFPGLFDLENSKHFLSSPARLYWDYGDNDLNSKWSRDDIINGRVPGLTSGFGFWAARKSGNPEYALYEIKNVPTYPDFNIFVLYDDLWKNASLESWPLDKAYRGPELATMRSSQNLDALFLGLKGGRLHEAASSHYALDAGNFVLDWAGLRWVWDMGIESYALKHAIWMSNNLYASRFNLYRESTGGANVLQVDGKNQEWRYKGDGSDINSWPASTIDTFYKGQSSSATVIDGRVAWDPNWNAGTFADVRSDAPPLARKVLSWKRGGALIDHKRSAVIVDEMTLSSPSTLTWQFHTVADVSVGQNEIVLTQFDQKLFGTDTQPRRRTMRVKVLEPLSFDISVVHLTPSMMYGKSPLAAACLFDDGGQIIGGCEQPKSIPQGMKRIEFKLKTKVSAARITVAFIPESADTPKGAVLPLERWRNGEILSPE